MKKLTVLTTLILVCFVITASVQPAYATSTPSTEDIAEAISGGVEWLIAVQNKPESPFWLSFGMEYYASIEVLLDGGWGIAIDEATGLPYPHSSAMDTSMAVIGLAAAVQYNLTTYYPMLSGYIEDGADWLVENQALDGSWVWRYIIAMDFPELPNLVSTYMGAMGLIFAGTVEPPLLIEHLDNVTAALTWMITWQNEDGGWGFLPAYMAGSGFPSFLVDSDTVVTSATLWALFPALVWGIEGIEGVIEDGVEYLLSEQEGQGSWFSPLMYATFPEDIPVGIRREYARTYATTRAVVSLISFKEAGIFFPTWEGQLERPILRGLKWIGSHNLRSLNSPFKTTRDVADGLIAFEEASRAGINVWWAKEKLRRALDWLIDTQIRVDDPTDPMDWGWGANSMAPDDIYHTSFAIAALAWSEHLPI